MLIRSESDWAFMEEAQLVFPWWVVAVLRRQLQQLQWLLLQIWRGVALVDQLYQLAQRQLEEQEWQIWQAVDMLAWQLLSKEMGEQILWICPTMLGLYPSPAMEMEIDTKNSVRLCWSQGQQISQIGP